jgi:hypothetical protein
VAHHGWQHRESLNPLAGLLPRAGFVGRLGATGKVRSTIRVSRRSPSPAEPLVAPRVGRALGYGSAEFVAFGYVVSKQWSVSASMGPWKALPSSRLTWTSSVRKSRSKEIHVYFELRDIEALLVRGYCHGRPIGASPSNTSA